MSGRWETERERFEATLREKSEIPPEATAVGVSLDGVMVPMKDREHAVCRSDSRLVLLEDGGELLTEGEILENEVASRAQS